MYKRQYLASRDPNRGDCAQPCRWRYRLEEESAPGVYHEIGEIPGQGSYLLNAGDLRMIEHIGALAAAGVDVYKRQLMDKRYAASGEKDIHEQDLAYLNPVSYTHLDVYKRQLPTSAPPSR